MAIRRREISDIKVKRLLVEDYKSIKKSNTQFTKGLNIIIGPNGSGKSNLLQILNLTTSLTSINSRLRYQFRNNTSYSIILNYKEDKIIYELTIIHRKSILRDLKDPKKVSNELHIIKKAKGKDTQEFKIPYLENDITSLVKNDQLSKELIILRRINKRFIKFSLPADQDSTWIATPAKLVIAEEGYLEFEDFTRFSLFEIFVDFYLNLNAEKIYALTKEKSSDNIKSFIFRLFENFYTDYNIGENLSRHTPIEEIRLNQNINIYFIEKEIHIENLLLEYKVSGNWIPWSYLSDGTKRLFYIVTQTLSIKNGLLIIEEPEIGIHPKQLFSLMNFFKEQSLEKQLFISTHSPIVLDVLSSEELDSITISNIEKNGSKFRKLTKKEKEKATSYMKSVGELSYYWLHSDLEHE